MHILCFLLFFRLFSLLLCSCACATQIYQSNLPFSFALYVAHLLGIAHSSSFNWLICKNYGKKCWCINVIVSFIANRWLYCFTHFGLIVILFFNFGFDFDHSGSTGRWPESTGRGAIQRGAFKYQKEKEKEIEKKMFGSFTKSVLNVCSVFTYMRVCVEISFQKNFIHCHRNLCNRMLNEWEICIVSCYEWEFGVFKNLFNAYCGGRICSVNYSIFGVQSRHFEDLISKPNPLEFWLDRHFL